MNCLNWSYIGRSATAFSDVKLKSVTIVYMSYSLLMNKTIMYREIHCPAADPDRWRCSHANLLFTNSYRKLHEKNEKSGLGPS